MKKLKHLELKYNHQVSNIFLGNYKTAFRGRGIEFSNFETYEYGDDSKDIDWLVSAREGKVLTKQFQEDRELQVLFVFDITESMNFGLEQKKSDTMLDVFYLLGLSTLHSGGSIGGVFIGKDREELNFSKGKSSIIRILKKIDEHLSINNENNLEVDFNDILSYKDKLVFVFSDKTEINDTNFRICSLKNDVIYINIFDEFENTLSINKGLVGLSGVSIDLENETKKNQYISLRSEKITELEKKINMLGGSYLQINEKSNIYKKILKLMRERQK